MCLCKVDNINIVAYARAVRRIVVVAENRKLLTDAHSRLCDIGNQIVRHTIGQFAYQGRRMGTDRIEISQDNALQRSTAVDIIIDDLLVDFLRITIGRSGFLMWGFFGNGKISRQGLAINRAA